MENRPVVALTPATPLLLDQAAAAAIADLNQSEKGETATESATFSLAIFKGLQYKPSNGELKLVILPAGWLEGELLYR